MPHLHGRKARQQVQQLVDAVQVELPRDAQLRRMPVGQHDGCAAVALHLRHGLGQRRAVQHQAALPPGQGGQGSGAVARLCRHELRQRPAGARAQVLAGGQLHGCAATLHGMHAHPALQHGDVGAILMAVHAEHGADVLHHHATGLHGEGPLQPGHPAVPEGMGYLEGRLPLVQHQAARAQVLRHLHARAGVQPHLAAIGQLPALALAHGRRQGLALQRGVGPEQQRQRRQGRSRACAQRPALAQFLALGGGLLDFLGRGQVPAQHVGKGGQGVIDGQMGAAPRRLRRSTLARAARAACAARDLRRHGRP